MTTWSKRILPPLMIALCFGLSLAQSQLGPQQLLLLIAGPSGDRISREEQAVVGFLNNLRGEYGLSSVQMGTMHFDRPRESRILKDSLGLRPDRGVSVALVQLSDRGVPVRTLYKREHVTQQSLQSDHRELLGRWSELSGETLPEALRPLANQGQAPQSSTNSQSTGRPATGNSEPQSKTGVVYTFEGIRTVVFDLQSETESIWSSFKNAPLREDRLDVPLRRSTLGLVEASKNLRRAHEEGVVYPLEQLEAVRQAGREWKLAEPEFYLPVDQRARVPKLLKLLDQVESIEYQGRRG